MPLTELEIAVLEKLLLGPHLVLDALRAQLPALSVTHRESTGVGFFTTFGGVGSSRGGYSGAFGDVEAQIPGLQNGAGFVLRVKEGARQSLEGYTYDEPWPRSVEGFALRYWNDDRTELYGKLGR